MRNEPDQQRPNILTQYPNRDMHLIRLVLKEHFSIHLYFVCGGGEGVGCVCLFLFLFLFLFRVRFLSMKKLEKSSHFLPLN